MRNLIMLVLMIGVGVLISWLVRRLFKSHSINTVDKQVDSNDDSLFLDLKEDLDKEVGALKLTVQELLAEIDFKFNALKEKEIHLRSLIGLADERIEKLSSKDNQESCNDSQVNDSQASQRIYELHQKGMSSVEIARSLGVGVGEVELRIGLLKKR